MANPLDCFDVKQFLSKTGVGRSVVPVRKGKGVYAQGDVCDSLFYILEGSVRLTVLSESGKEATIALLNANDFAGEECVSTTQTFRPASALALTDALLLRISRIEMLRVLSLEPALSKVFVSYLLERTNRIQADLIDQLLNSSEKRLARTLLLLANFGQQGVPEALVPDISQETLAEMIGCTRSRVNFFLNRFRRLGLIEYDDRIRVNKGLLQILL